MREFLIKIFKSAIENWLVSLLTTAGLAIVGWVLWLCRSYLKNRITLRGKKEPIGVTDIKNVLGEWFRSDVQSQISGKIRFEKTVFFSDLDEKLNLTKGSSECHIEDVVKQFSGWGTKDKGRNTIVIYYDGLPIFKEILKKASDQNSL
jgi:hypothetical protein